MRAKLVAVALLIGIGGVLAQQEPPEPRDKPLSKGDDAVITSKTLTVTGVDPSAGPPGMNILVQGSGFGEKNSDVEVTADGTKCLVLMVTNEGVRFFLPNTAKPGTEASIEIKTRNGTARLAFKVTKKLSREERWKRDCEKYEGGARYEDPFKGPKAPPKPEAPFKSSSGDDTKSTFGIDVDTASYTYARRFLRRGELPDPESIRIEELVNAFDLEDPAPPTDGKPFATRVEIAGCPWKPENRLVRISLKGREIPPEKRPVSNLVFLIDVSGSMDAPKRLPLLKSALRLLVERLSEKDSIAIVVYAGAAGLVLPPTSGAQTGTILDAIERLHAGGSTNGGAGIQLAYRTAVDAFVEGGSNRVVLCTDGDWNVGTTSTDELERLISEKRKSGVFLTCLGFEVSSSGDRTLSTLADKGNGHFVAIDDMRDARRVLVDDMAGTLVTIAKDVKVQVEWNPERVNSWRLLGYEKRALANADFANDAKDSGEMGAGHRVTALYEVEPKPGAGPTLTVRLRWKQPDAEASQAASDIVATDAGTSFEDSTVDFKFAASVAAAGMLFRKSAHAQPSWANVVRWASAGKGLDARGQREEWIDLMKKAATASGQNVD